MERYEKYYICPVCGKILVECEIYAPAECQSDGCIKYLFIPLEETTKDLAIRTYDIMQEKGVDKYDADRLLRLELVEKYDIRNNPRVNIEKLNDYINYCHDSESVDMCRQSNIPTIWEFADFKRFIEPRRDQARREAKERAEIGKPRCPTCRSTDIQKISAAEKVGGGLLFGLFSSNIRHTYKCNNCGYKW